MRIIAGQYRGRRLVAPAGDTTRPTADRTRETLFSMLTSRLGSFEGLAVLDLFAGSGALGLEALSRGAATCTFVEQDAAALSVLRRNLAALAVSTVDIKATSVMALGPAKRAFDLILADPPYGSNAGAVALDRLGRLGWIAPSAWLSLESGRDEVLSVAGYTIDAERNVGKAKLILLRPLSSGGAV